MKPISIQSFIPQDSRNSSLFFFSVISILYFLNFWVNDIWTPNESFYAEAVREMFESGDFLNIKFNYEPRYNKPPLTYWLIALSSKIFGLNEFGIRLPIVLMGLGSIWFTYRIAYLEFGRKLGIYAMCMMAVSLQLMAVKQYASPETPLTFFFTLTMYLFLKGYRSGQFKYLLLSYISLGLTALTKGYPYIIVVGGIIGTYIVLESNFNIRTIFKKIIGLKLHIGIFLALIIGLSWVIFMYLKDGDAFWLVYKRETLDRAFTKATRGPRPFFYLGVIVWSIMPYSLSFYYALINRLKSFKSIKNSSFGISWFIVMLVIFTIAKGKIPTYIIQAHPAMILITLPLLKDFDSKVVFWSALWKTAFILPTFLISLGSYYLTYILGLPYIFFIIPTAVCAILILGFQKESASFFKIAPFWAMFGFLIIFCSYLPQLEIVRPYNEIEATIEKHAIPQEKSILIDGWLIHNVPFYAARYAEKAESLDQINNDLDNHIALVRNENLAQISTEHQVLWSGLIYDFSSESQFFKFVMAAQKAISGDESKFHTYHLIASAE